MPKSISHISVPRQKRAKDTYNRLVTVTGELLDEVGFERVSTNLIAERAGVSPPALYRYFKDKYDLIGAFGRRVMDVQNELLSEIGEKLQTDPDYVLTSSILTNLNLRTIELTEEISGGVQVMTCLRVIPALSYVRTDSHHDMAAALAKAAVVFRPRLSEAEVYRQSRLSIEIGYTAIEFVLENPDLDRRAIIRDASNAIAAFNDVVERLDDPI
ncbi:MAG: TetR/AcrR family transcriptional regulator [Pseudomonadota bacterium]